MGKKLDQHIAGALNKCVLPTGIIQIESLMISEIITRLKEGRSTCVECDLNALSFHNTIKLVFTYLEQEEKKWKDIEDVILS